MTPVDPAQTGPIRAVEENVNAIKSWDRAALLKLSRLERLSDKITSAAASSVSLVAHVMWFSAWIAINTGWLPVACRSTSRLAATWAGWSPTWSPRFRLS